MYEYSFHLTIYIYICVCVCVCVSLDLYLHYNNSIEHNLKHTFVCILLFLSFESFSRQRLLIVFHWSLCDSKSLHVSRTLLNILADHNNGHHSSSYFQILQSLYQIFGYSTERTNHRGIIVIFMLHSFSVLWQGRSTYLSFRFLSVLPRG